MSSLYEQLRIRFYIHQNFPGDDFGVSKIKVKQACLNKLQYFIVCRIGAFAVFEDHHSDADAFASIQYIIRSEAVRFSLESVREDQLGLHSFRSMRRMEASLRKASALRLRHSQSLASLRQRPSQAKVRSTIQRLGRTTKRWG